MYNMGENLQKGKETMYEVIKTKIILEGETQKKTTYGLRHDDGTVFEDVSANREEAERLARYFTEQGLAPYQLKDVLTDMIDTGNGFEM